MDFMKVFDQTVREIKREVNLKVLKVPEIEQKVLDATDNEPWGPHGSALSEIAQATKKFTECQMVMNVLWTRLSETGKDWRYVYKALTVIEYLVANGSERAVDDIIEHTFQISSLSSFEYVEPSGKDVGLNVRKKAETIVALLNNKDKIQEARNKAASNRDKYVGLSSSGITYKSGSASSYSSSGGFGSSDRYGGFGGKREGEGFTDGYRGRERHEEEKDEKDTYRKPRRGATNENQRKGSARYSSKEDDISSSASKSAAKLNDSDTYNPVSSQSSTTPPNHFDDDFDDFDPRGTSSTKPAAGNFIQVDLLGDFIDPPTSLPGSTETSAMNGNSSEVDLFEDATFVSAPTQADKAEVDLFASQPAFSSTVPATVDLFSAPDPVVQPETKAPKSEPTHTNIVDPFAAVPLNNFDGSDPFGAFTSHSGPVSAEPAHDPLISGVSQNNLSGKSSTDSKPPPKKDTFQVRSGIWADSLSRGLIDLNISAPKKVSLVDVGIVGGLTDEADPRDRGLPTSLYMGQATGGGTGLGNSRFHTSQPTGGDDFFSSLGSHQYQYGGFQK